MFAFKRAGKFPEHWDPVLMEKVLGWMAWLVPFILFFSLVVHYTNSARPDDFIRRHVFSVLVFFPLVITMGDLEFTYWLASSHLLASILSLYETDNQHEEKERKRKREAMAHQSLLVRLGLSPAQLILLTFGGLILIGTLLLMIPVSTKGDKALSFVDALFMATSAICVTGLSTVSLEQNFTFIGQVILLLLIQVGGLGFMTLSTVVTLIIGRSMALKDRLIMQDMLDVSTQEELIGLIVDIIKYTFVIELWGGIILTIGFTLQDFELGKAFYYGFFHAISAFCNAGFALFDNSLESFATDPLIHVTVAILIILGGLGFPVLRELKFAAIKRKSFVLFSLHSKIVIVTTFFFLAGGTLFIFFGEFLHALDGYNLWEKIQISFFQSTTLRTAGYNTIPLANLNKYTVYVFILFMFVGAAPGSTGGGVKVTTFAILIQAVRASLTGRSQVEIFERRLSQATVVRSTALMILSIMITSFFIFIMMKLEPDKNFLSLSFETISAFGTVGLSLGITPYLSVGGKIALSILMFIGRTGPLTLVLAIGQRTQGRGQYEYPEGRVIIG
jgi:trk system potassium uptake protein TrkH